MLPGQYVQLSKRLPGNKEWSFVDYAIATIEKEHQ
jgi:hypothetical protein